MTRPGKNPAASGIRTRDLPLSSGHLTTRPTRRYQCWGLGFITGMRGLSAKWLSRPMANVPRCWLWRVQCSRSSFISCHESSYRGFVVLCSFSFFFFSFWFCRSADWRYDSNDNDIDDDHNDDGVDSNNDNNDSKRHYWGCLLSSLLIHLVGLVVRRPPRERKVPGSNPACVRIFFGVESYLWLKNWYSSGYPARRLAL